MQPRDRRRDRPGPPVHPEPRGLARTPSRRGGAGRLSLDRVIRTLLGVAAAAAVGWLLWYFSALVLYLVLGVLLAYLMRPLVDRMQGVGLGRVPAILITFVLVFGVITVLLTQLVPFVGMQLSELSGQLSFGTAARVTAVDPLSRADDVGLQRGDVILRVEHQPWQGYEHLQAVLNAREPGEGVRVTVEAASGVRREVVLAAGAPARDAAREMEVLGDAGPEAEPNPVRYVPALGLTMREVTYSPVAGAVERRLRGLFPIRPGAVVEGVTAGLDTLFQEERITRFAGSVVGLFTDLFYAVLIIPFVAFFVLKDGLQIRHSLLRFVPNRYFEVVLALVEKIEAIVGRYFKALLIQCLSVAGVATVLLYAVGLEYAFAVGLFTGLANTIPYFGPLIGFLAGTLVGIVQTGDFTLVPGVLVAMALTQVADNAFFQPFIFSRAAQMHPLVILFAVLMGAQLVGIVGMLLAIPVATIIRVTVGQILWSLRNYRILRSV